MSKNSRRHCAASRISVTLICWSCREGGVVMWAFKDRFQGSISLSGSIICLHELWVLRANNKCRTLKVTSWWHAPPFHFKENVYNIRPSNCSVTVNMEKGERLGRRMTSGSSSGTAPPFLWVLFAHWLLGNRPSKVSGPFTAIV